AEIDALKQAFIPNLVRIRDDGTFIRQHARLSELPADARRLMDAFVGARLLSKRVEVHGTGADEILVEGPLEERLKAWLMLHLSLEEEKIILIGKRQLRQASIDYRAASKSSYAVLQGLQLRRA